MCFQEKSICAPGQEFKYAGGFFWYELEVAQKNAVRIKMKGWTEEEMKYKTYLNTPEKANHHFDTHNIWFDKDSDNNAIHPIPPWTPVWDEGRRGL